NLASVSGGAQNAATDTEGAILGGCGNTTGTGSNSHDCGNQVAPQADSIIGGRDNTANDVNASVSGGRSNTASADSSSISGGVGNGATDPSSSIAGGCDTLTAIYNHTSPICDIAVEAILGGQHNNATGDETSITGGEFNLAVDQFSSIAGGCNNLTRAGTPP